MKYKNSRKSALYILLTLLLPVAGYCATASFFSPTDDRTLLKDKSTQDANTDVFSASQYKNLGYSICLIVKSADVKECNPTTTDPVNLPCAGVDLKLFGTLSDVLKNTFGKPACEMTNPVKFKDEKCVGSCGTGVAIEKDLVLTCSHIFNTENLGSATGCVVLFNMLDYSSSKKCAPDANYTNVNTYQYFRIKEVVKDFKNEGRDLVIVRLDHCINSEITWSGKYLSMYQSNTPVADLGKKSLYTIGHPNGLPLMFVNKGIVKTDLTAADVYFGNQGYPPVTSFKYCLFTNLDIAAGMSGAPVFVQDAAFGYKIIGLISHGKDDYEQKSGQNCASEIWYTEAQFNAKPPSAIIRVQTLQDINLTAFLKTDVCPEVIVKSPCTGIVPPVIPCDPYTGQKVFLEVPGGGGIGNKFDVRCKYTYATGGTTDFSVVAMGGTSAWFIVPNKASYFIKIYNQDGTSIPNSPTLSGVANGNVIAGCLYPKKGFVFGSLNKVAMVPPEEPVTPVVLASISTLNTTVGGIGHIVHFQPSFNNRFQKVSFLWDFGDGTTSTQQFPSHQYLSGGSFTVSLTYDYEYLPDAMEPVPPREPKRTVIMPDMISINSELYSSLFELGNTPLIGSVFINTQETVANQPTIETSNGNIYIDPESKIQTVGSGYVKFKTK